MAYFTLCLSTTNIVVDRAKKNVRTLFPPKNREKIHISINVDYLLTPSVSMFIEGSSLEAHLPIPLRRPHLWRLWRRPSGLRQRLRHSSLSPHPPKWIPLPLRQPPRPPMHQPLPSPLVWRLLSMLRILSKGGGGGAVARWRGDDDVRVLASARCCRRRGEDATFNIRWEVGGGR